MPRQSKITNRVLAWRGMVQQIREDRGIGGRLVNPSEGWGMPDWIVVGLIAKESSGNPAAFNEDNETQLPTGLLQITNQITNDMLPEVTNLKRKSPERKAAADRALRYFDGRESSVESLYTSGNLGNAVNPQLVAARNSINMFYDYQKRYRFHAAQDPLRISMLWKSGPGALRRLNEALVISEFGSLPANRKERRRLFKQVRTIPVTDPRVQQYLKDLRNNSDGYVNSMVQIFSETREKMGSAAPRSFSPTTGAAQTSTTQPTTEVLTQSVSPPQTSGPANLQVTQRQESIVERVPESADCAPEFTTRIVTYTETNSTGTPVKRPVSTERQAVAQTVREKSTSFAEINFVDSIKEFYADQAELNRVKFAKQYSKRAVTNVETFLQQASDPEDTAGVSGRLSLAFGNVQTNFVKPLDVFEVRQPFGQDRNRNRRGKTLVRQHLGLDLETRDAAEIERREQFKRNATRTSPRQDGFGQKPCYAIADGIIRVAGEVGFYGLVIYIEHTDGGARTGVSSRYAHLSKLLVGVGDTVTKGQQIAVTGTTEVIDGKLNHAGVEIPHLHFEIRVNIETFRGNQPGNIRPNTQNVALNPVAILAQAPGPNDPPGFIQRPEEKAVAEAKGAAASILVNAENEHVKLVAAQAYDQVTALQRSCDIANMSREQLWTEASRVAPVQRNVVAQETLIEDGDLVRYGSTPLEG